MASNLFGSYFVMMSWGESHGRSMGVVIDGCPAGVDLNEALIQAMLDERSPGKALTSPRREPDQVQIHSGVFGGKTTGAPIALVIENRQAKSEHYEPIKAILRPGHANYTYQQKYGVFDYRGGGRASARETVSRVAAAAVAKAWLDSEGIEIAASIVAMGTHHYHGDFPESMAALKHQRDQHSTRCHDVKTHQKMEAALLQAMEEGDSLGAQVRLVIDGLPVGLGDPVFAKFEAKLAQAIMSIPATKGFSLGEGFEAVHMKGSMHNDAFVAVEGRPCASNHAGGTLGGITTGMPVVAHVAFKPTSSIRKAQQSVDMQGNSAVLNYPQGSRHDPCVGIRGVTVVEAMAYLVVADCVLAQRLVQC